MQKKGIAQRFGAIVAGSGLLAGVAVSVVMTFLDWHLNPGDVFRSASGTNWLIVRETAWSWFWPVALLAAGLAAPVAGFLLWRQPRK